MLSIGSGWVMPGSSRVGRSIADSPHRSPYGVKPADGGSLRPLGRSPVAELSRAAYRGQMSAAVARERASRRPRSMRDRLRVATLALVVSLSAIVSSPATASLRSSAAPEDGDAVGPAAESIVVPETTPDGGASGAAGDRSTPDGSDESGAGPGAGAWLGLPLEVDASGQLGPGLPPPGLL